MCRIGNEESLNTLGMPYYSLRYLYENNGLNVNFTANRNMKDRTVYLVYGSNVDDGQMLARCPHSELIGKAVVEGYRFAPDEVGDTLYMNVLVYISNRGENNGARKQWSKKTRIYEKDCKGCRKS